MPKLNQIIAISAGKKSQAHKTITEAYQNLQKGGQLEGISRTYKPKDDEGEQLPPEKKLVQLKVRDAIRGVVAALTELFDVVATQDYANCLARANVTVDNVTVLTRTTGLPLSHDDVGNWGETLAVWAMFVELAVVSLSAIALSGRRARA